MTPDEHQFCGALPYTQATDSATFVHATPDEPGACHYLFSCEDARNSFDAFDTPVCFVGHSHVPTIYVQKSEDPNDVDVVFSPEVTVQTKGSYKVLMNVGSVGQPRDEDPRAAYAIYDVETGEASIRRVGYDISSAQRKILDAGLPEVLANRLALGV